MSGNDLKARQRFQAWFAKHAGFEFAVVAFANLTLFIVGDKANSTERVAISLFETV